MEFRAEFTSTVEDAITSQRMLQQRKEERWGVYLFGAAFALVLFTVMGFLADVAMLWVIGGFFALFIILQRAMLSWMERDHRKRLVELPEPKMTVRMNAEGLHIVGSDSSNEWTGHHAWDQFKQVKMDERGVLFFTDPRIPGLFVPARAFGPIFPREELKMFFEQMIKRPNQPPQTTATSGRL